MTTEEAGPVAPPARRKRPRPATTARILATGAALSATSVLVAAMGSARPAPTVAPPLEAPATTQPAPPPVRIVIVRRAAPAPTPSAPSASTGSTSPSVGAGQAQPAPRAAPPVTAAPAPPPATVSTAS